MGTSGKRSSASFGETGSSTDTTSIQRRNSGNFFPGFRSVSGWSWEEGTVAAGALSLLLGACLIFFRTGKTQKLADVQVGQGSGQVVQEHVLAGRSLVAGRAAGQGLRDTGTDRDREAVAEERLMEGARRRATVNVLDKEALPGVLEVRGNNLEVVLQMRPSLVMFYAPWCPHCERIQPLWQQLALILHKKNFNVQVVRVDTDRYPYLLERHELKGFPSIVLFDGPFTYTYRGARDLESIMKFVDERID